MCATTVIGALFGLYDWKFEVMGLLWGGQKITCRFGNLIEATAGWAAGLVG